MRMRRTLAYLVFASCVVVFVVKNRAAESHSGDWTISKSDNPGKVEFSLIEHHHGGMSNHQSDWPASSFPGVDFSKSGRQDVRFTIVVMENRLNEEQQYLPAHFVVNTWDVATGTLKSSETNHQTWQRVGSFDLPATVRTVTATAGKLETRTLTLSNHKLMGASNSKER